VYNIDNQLTAVHVTAKIANGCPWWST